MLWSVTLGLGSNVECLTLWSLSIWYLYDSFHNDDWDLDMFILWNIFEVFFALRNITYYFFYLKEWLMSIWNILFVLNLFALFIKSTLGIRVLHCSPWRTLVLCSLVLLALYSPFNLHCEFSHLPLAVVSWGRVVSKALCLSSPCTRHGLAMAS